MTTASSASTGSASMNPSMVATMAAMGTAPAGSKSAAASSLSAGEIDLQLFDLQQIIQASGEERARYVQAFGDALRDDGFLAVRATEISDLIKRVNEQMQRYFAQSHEKKMEDDHQNNYQTGFWPPGMETAAGAAQPDNKETYFVPPNYERWPTFTSLEEAQEFKSVIEEYRTHLVNYAVQALTILTEYLGEEPTDVAENIKAAHNLLRLAHYFENKGDRPRAGAHTDLNCITFLPPATDPGLELMTKRGEWKAVNVPKDYLIVNTGEQLEKKSAGKIQATLHRVVNPNGAEKAVERFASIFFASWQTDFSLAPFTKLFEEMTRGKSDAEIEALKNKYPNVTVGQNLLSRLIEMGSIPEPGETLVSELRNCGLLRQPPQAIIDLYPHLF